MILVDSSVWIDFFNGRVTQKTDHLNALLGISQIVTGDIILLEVLHGFKSDRDFKTANSLMAEFICYEMFNKEIALKAISNYRKLRRRGITVRKTIDCIIATFCLEHKLTLLHDDRDFDGFEKKLKLMVYNE
ncbi:MAG: PIN domain nuclease [Cyclobacteriaceae bacterium]